MALIKPGTIRLREKSWNSLIHFDYPKLVLSCVVSLTGGGSDCLLETSRDYRHFH